MSVTGDESEWHRKVGGERRAHQVLVLDADELVGDDPLELDPRQRLQQARRHDQ
jgi:hypothetical protein